MVRATRSSGSRLWTWDLPQARERLGLEHERAQAVGEPVAALHRRGRSRGSPRRARGCCRQARRAPPPRSIRRRPRAPAPWPRPRRCGCLPRHRRRAPDVDATRLWLPQHRVLRPREHGDGAVLGGHGHPLGGLRHHRGLTRDRIAEHCEAQAPARASRPHASSRSDSGGDLAVVVGLEVDALALEDAAQAVVVRERAVVDEAQVSGRGRSTTGGECSVVTRLSVALRV